MKNWELIVLITCNLALFGYAIWLAVYRVMPAVRLHDWSQATFYLLCAWLILQATSSKSK